MDLLTHRHILRPRQEDAADRGVQHPGTRSEFQDLAVLLVLGSPFGRLGMEEIQTVRNPLQVDGNHLTGGRRPFADERTVLGIKHIAQRDIDLVPVTVLHFHPEPGHVLRRDVLGRLRTPAPADIADRAVGVLLLHRHELALGGVLHGQGDGDIVADIDPGAEFLHFAGGVGRGDTDTVPAGFLRLEGEGERAVGLRTDRFLQDDGSPVVHLGGESCSAEAVPGVTPHLAADHHFIALQVEFVIGIEGEGECGQDKLVHPEVIRDEMLLPGGHLDVEIAVLLPLREGEGAGHGAELIGFQLQAFQGLALGIEQGNLHLLVRDDGHPVHKVPLIHDGLELEDIAGIVGAPVLIDIAVQAVGAVRAVGLGSVGMDRDLLAGAEVFSGARLGGKGIIDIPVPGDGLTELCGQEREAVQADRLAEDLRISLPENQFHLVQGLAGDIIGHIGGVPRILAAGREGKRMLVVIGDSAQFSVHGLHGVGAVTEFRKRHPDGIHHIETAGGIGKVPGLERLLVQTEREGGLVQVAEGHDRVPGNDPDIQILGCQSLHKVLRLFATFDDPGVVALESSPLLLEVLAFAVKGLVGVLPGLVLIQPVELHPEQVLPGPQGDGLPGILLRHFFHRRLPERLRADAGGRIVGQIPLSGVPAGDFLLQRPVDFILLRPVPIPVSQKMPQDILVVGGQETFHFSAHQGADIPVESRVMPGAESLGPGLHIGPAGIGGLTAVIPHPEVGDHRVGESLHLLPEVRAEFLPLFPVPALDGLHVQHGGVIEIHGQMPFPGFRLDFREDFRLGLGAVGFPGRFILLPKRSEFMPVLVRGWIGIHHRGDQQGNDGRKGCQDIFFHKQSFLRYTPFNNRTTGAVLPEQGQGLGDDEGGAADEYQRTDGLGTGSVGGSGESLGELEGHLDSLPDGTGGEGADGRGAGSGGTGGPGIGRIALQDGVGREGPRRVRGGEDIGGVNRHERQDSVQVLVGHHAIDDDER